MSDPRDAFLSRVDLGDTRVRAFTGFLFLCGGPQDTTTALPLRSVRHLIYNKLTSGKHSRLAGRLRLAEDIQDWFRDGKYQDLVTFEEHLASLSSVILLVVESPGSIAELGAFAVTRTISERLVAMIAERYYNEESFIKLGPLRRLTADTGREAFVYDWHEDAGYGRVTERFEKIEEHLDEVFDEVGRLLETDHGERVFKSSIPAHVMLLICEFCDLFGAVSETEIKDYVRRLDESVTVEVIEQYLFLLERCGLLSIKAHGHGRYYYPPSWEPHITFAFTPGDRVERDRVRVDVVEFYKHHIKSRATVVRLVRGAA